MTPVEEVRAIGARISGNVDTVDDFQTGKEVIFGELESMFARRYGTKASAIESLNPVSTQVLYALFQVLAEPILKTESFEDALEVAEEARLITQRILPKDYDGSIGGLRGIDYFVKENSSASMSPSWAYYRLLCLCGYVKYYSPVISIYTDDHVVHFCSFMDLPEDEMYRLFLMTSHEAKVRSFRAMAENVKYMLHFYDTQAVPGDDFFLRCLADYENIVHRSSAVFGCEGYGSFWNASRNMLMLSNNQEARQIALEMGEFVSNNHADKKLRGIFAKKTGIAKNVVKALRLGKDRQGVANAIRSTLVYGPQKKTKEDPTAVAKAQVDLVEAVQNIGQIPPDKRYHHPLWQCFYGH